MQFNYLYVAGAVGAQPKDEKTGKGERVVRFPLRLIQADGRVLWLRVSAFGDLCELASRVKKDDNVVAIGCLEVTTYRDSLNTERTAVDVIAQKIGLMAATPKGP